MDGPSLDMAHKGGELALAILAFVSIIVTQIVTTKLNSQKIETLSKHVESQNGKLNRTAARIVKMQIRCAGLHGVELPLEEILDDDPGEDEPG
jgi:hypothetical protein